MKLLKKIISSLIDLAILLGCILVIYPLLSIFNIEFEQKYFLLITFTIAYFIPIIFLKNTLGKTIFKIQINSSTKLLFKYLIYYIIFSGVVANVIGLIIELTPLNYRPIQIQVHLLYALFSCIIVNILFFVFSLGKYSLIDFLLNLNYLNVTYKRSKYLYLLSWLSILLLTTVFEVSGETSFFSKYLNQFINSNLNYNYTKYFPKEKFDDYSYFQIEKIENNDMVLSFSNRESFYKSYLLTQKTIYALINKSTFENADKRLEFCHLINIYSDINDFFNFNDIEIDQTRFVLIYIKPETYFSHKSYTFYYYYDNKNPKFSYYGGVESDSLKTSYIKDLNRESDLLNSFYAKVLGISIDSLTKKYKRYSEIKLTKKQNKLLISEYNKEIVKNEYFVITIIPFKEVKPVIIRSFNLKHNVQLIESTNNQNWEDNLFKALAWRDFYEQNNK